MKEQKTCPHCGRPLMAGDTECGYCGAKLGSGNGKKTLILLVVLAVVAALVLGGWWLYQNDPLGLLVPPGPDYPEHAPADFDTEASDAAEIPGDLLAEAVVCARECLEEFPYSQANLADFLVVLDYPEDLARQAAAETGADWNANALARIDLLLADEYDGHSLAGLADALYYAGFTQEQIDYAMENLPEIDWQEQADRCAAGYLDAIPMSRADLLGQLEYEGFAPENALAAVENCGADWAENALTRAREESFLTDREELRTILEEEEFTDEEIEYALKNR